MTSRFRILTGALALCVLALPAASLAHEGHEHSEPGQTTRPPSGDPDASSQAQDDAAAERAARRRQKADEDAAKAKAATPKGDAASPSNVRPGSGQH